MVALAGNINCFSEVALKDAFAGKFLIGGALNDDVASGRDAGAAELFSIFLEHKTDISRVTFRGVYDKISWLNNRPVRWCTSYPLLFDRNYQPKPAFDTVIKTTQLEAK